MLRGKKPEAVQKRFKGFFYGYAGCGKTMTSLNFPSPYVIDTERGAENDRYLKLIDKNEGAIFQSVSFDEIYEEIKTLLTVSHPYKTLIIDPITTIYANLLDKCEDMLEKKPKKSGFTGHYQLADKIMKRLMALIFRLDMNVILTAHAKTEYKMQNGILENVGVTFDGYKKHTFDFDLVLRIDQVGSENWANVKKTRIDGFGLNDRFPFNFEEIEKKLQLDKSYKNMEAPAIPINLATKEQIIEVERLIKLLNVSDEIVAKWLTKAKVNDFDEMTGEHIEKCLSILNEKIKGEANV